MYMGFLNKIFGEGKQETVLFSPVKGQMSEITEVKDETFAQKMLGDGIAIIPSDGKIISPCDGMVDNMFETGHAFSLVTEDGLEVLIHVGLDTVKLKGKHFTVVRNTGEKVKKGDTMVEVDFDAVKGEGYDTTVVMVILNSEEYSAMEKAEGEVEAGAEVLKMTKK